MSKIGIVYIGNKPQKFDNVAGTNLTWVPGQTHQVEEAAAKKLLAHPSIWADASTYDPKAVANSPVAVDMALHDFLNSDKCVVVVVDRETIDSLRAGGHVVEIIKRASATDEASLTAAAPAKQPASLAAADTARAPSTGGAGVGDASDGGAGAEGKPAVLADWDFERMTKNQIAKRLKDEYGHEVNPDKFNKEEIAAMAADVIATKQKKAA